MKQPTTDEDEYTKIKPKRYTFRLMVIKFYIYSIVLLGSTFLYSCKTVQSELSVGVASSSYRPLGWVNNTAPSQTFTSVPGVSNEFESSYEAPVALPTSQKKQISRVAPFTQEVNAVKVKPDTIYVRSAQQAWEVHRRHAAIPYRIVGIPLTILGFLLAGAGLFILIIPGISLLLISSKYAKKKSSNIGLAATKMRRVARTFTVIGALPLLIPLIEISRFIVLGGLTEFLIGTLIFLGIYLIVLVPAALLPWLAARSVTRYGRSIGLPVDRAKKNHAWF